MQMLAIDRLRSCSIWHFCPKFPMDFFNYPKRTLNFILDQSLKH